MKVVMVLYPGNGHEIEFGELEGQPVPGSAGEEIEDDHLIVEGGEIVSGTYRAIYEAPASES